MDAPAVAVSANGKSFAASWMDCQLEKGNRDLFWTLDGKKTPALASDTKGVQSHPALTCDRRGVFWAVWEDQRSGKREIWYTCSEKDFGDRRLSDLQTDGSAAFPAVATGGGLVVAAYEAGDRSIVVRILNDVKQ